MASSCPPPREGSLPLVSPRLPRWLKRNVPKGSAGRVSAETAELVRQLGLNTVCRHAGCPNRMECYAQQTATFMILGEICTRGCRFCGVTSGSPRPPEPDEPRRVAEASRRLGLRHVVITCVTRDDLPDGGAEHFFQTVQAVREATRDQSGQPATIEVLPSDFAGNARDVERVVEARPDVYNHNTETVPRLFHAARHPRTDPDWTLEMFRLIGRLDPAMKTKTGIMLGLPKPSRRCSTGLAGYARPAAGC